MTIYIDANMNLRSCRRLRDCGGFVEYQGKAEPGDFVVRYGANFNQYGNYGHDVTVLNPNIIFNKLNQIHLLNRAGVVTPASWDSREEWKVHGEPDQIIRKKYFSAGGYGIKKVAPNEQEFHNYKYYYQEFIDKEREFRLFQVGPMIAYLMEKPEIPGQIAWNMRGNHGTWSSFGGPDSLRDRLRELGKATLDAIGYDFAAIDVVYKNDQLYVLEANSRPTLGPRNAERVAATIIKYIEGGGADG